MRLRACRAGACLRGLALALQQAEVRDQLRVLGRLLLRRLPRRIRLRLRWASMLPETRRSDACQQHTRAEGAMHTHSNSAYVSRYFLTSLLALK